MINVNNMPDFMNAYFSFSSVYQIQAIVYSFKNLFKIKYLWCINKLYIYDEFLFSKQYKKLIKK